MSSRGSSLPLIQGARAVQNTVAESSQWPYPWLFPGPGTRPVRQAGNIQAPALGSGPTVVTSFIVPQGFYFSFRGIVALYTGTGFVEGSGSIIWQVLRGNGGEFVADYGNITTHLGSFDAPFPITGPLIFDQLEEIDLVVSMINTVTVGPGNIVSGMLVGHIWPI